MKPLSRRTLLRGAGGVALALPFLEAMRPARVRAQAAASPRRIIFVFQANGDQTDARFTATGETSFQLGEFLAPLEPYREQLLFLNKLNKRFYELPAGEVTDHPCHLLHRCARVAASADHEVERLPDLGRHDARGRELLCLDLGGDRARRGE